MRAFLPEEFAGDPVQAARELLGAVLRRALPSGQVLSGRIVETEAYDCPRDPSCSAGRFHVARSAELSAAPGHYGFWVTHGHPLLQVLCRPEGVSASILIRALEPLEGEDIMLDYRPVTGRYALTSGPAKLVQALGLDVNEVRGKPVNWQGLSLLRGEELSEEQIEITTRKGVMAGRELPWRFRERGNKWLSG